MIYITKKVIIITSENFIFEFENELLFSNSKKND